MTSDSEPEASFVIIGDVEPLDLARALGVLRDSGIRAEVPLFGDQPRLQRPSAFRLLLQSFLGGWGQEGFTAATIGVPADQRERALAALLRARVVLHRRD